MEASHHHHLFPQCPHHHHLHHHHHPPHPHHHHHLQGVVHPHPVHHHHHPHPHHHHHHHPLCILKPPYLPTQSPLLHPNIPQYNTNLHVLEEPQLLQEYVEIDEEDDNEEPVFVMTDEWMEFFAKSEAKRQLQKKQAKKEKKMNKGTD